MMVKALAMAGIAAGLIVVGWVGTFICLVNAFPLPDEF